MIKKIEAHGSKSGNAFHLETESLIKEVVVRSGGWVDAIAIKDSKGNGQSAGGSGGGVATLTLDDDEYIVEISGTYGHYIGRLHIRTNKGKTGTYGAAHGGNSAHAFELRADEGFAIVGLHGTAGSYLNSLGAYVAQIPSVDSPDLPDMSGSNFPKF
ncbi:MAG: hypothetical protein MI810_24935 [Flavobacteriales bacterium]|jgi:hypothetical protein|nr:hypothetical protein [Flavobacteriales bacterium]